MKNKLLKIAEYLSSQGLYQQAAQIKKIAIVSGVSVSNGNVISGGVQAKIYMKIGFSPAIPVNIQSIRQSKIPTPPDGVLSQEDGYEIVGSGLGKNLSMFITTDMFNILTNTISSGTESSMTLEFCGPKGNKDSKTIIITPV